MAFKIISPFQSDIRRSFWLKASIGSLLLASGLLHGQELIVLLGLLVISDGGAFLTISQELINRQDKKLLWSAGRRLAIILAITAVWSWVLAWCLPAGHISGILLADLNLDFGNILITKIIILASLAVVLYDRNKLWLSELLFNYVLFLSWSGLAIAIRLTNWSLALNMLEVWLFNVLLLILIYLVSFYFLALYASKKQS